MVKMFHQEIRQDFSSFIFPCENEYEIEAFNNYLNVNERLFLNNFKNIEIILIIPISIENYLEDKININLELKDNCYILTISNWETWDISVFTSLSRVNGDYTYILDCNFPSDFEKISRIRTSYENNFDIFLFKNKTSPFYIKNKFSNILMFFCFRMIANLPISPYDRRELCISRRALNSILRNARKNILLIELVYKSSYPYKKISLENKNIFNQKRFTKYKRGIQWSMLMRFSNLPTRISSLSTTILFLFSLLISTNALLVKFTGFNIFLNKSEIVPGWTYLVIMISVISLLLNLSVYSLQKSILVIYDEITKKSFDVNSYKRFEK